MNESMIDEAQVASLLKGVVIPPRPEVLTELMQEMRAPAANGKRIAELISRDPGLAATVLKFANSAATGGRDSVTTVSRALNYLGFGTVFNVVIGALLRQSVSTSGTMLARFWDNSVLTAAVSSSLAAIVDFPSKDTAYTFGLLHDCGIPLLAQRFEHYKTVLVAANSAKYHSFTAVEDAELGTNHAAVGYFLARSWGLPKPFSQAVLHHHDYALLTQRGQIPHETGSLIAINVVASYVAGQCLRGAQDVEWDKGSAAAAAWLGYSPGELEDMAGDLINQFSESSRMTMLLD